MSKVDDELSRRFHRAERPVGSDDVFEGLARRRRRRRTVQRLEAGALAIAVVALTTGGFVALQRAFDENPSLIGGPLAGNGEIVFSARGDDGFVHLSAVRPDGSGRRSLTDFGSDDTDADVSPDGRAVVFAHRLERSDPVVATIPMDGGTVTWLTDPTPAVRDPAWSPSGTEVAFVGDPSGPWLSIVDAGGGRTRTLFPDAGPEAAHPTWSPDGAWIAFAARNLDRTDGGWDLATVRPDGSGLSRIVVGDVDDHAPAWSPDGTRIAFIRPGQTGDEVWTVAPDGSDKVLIATAVEASLERDLSWAPDGSSLLVSDGDWIYRVDASPEGDPRDNFVQLVKGFSPSWQPIPVGSGSSPTDEPSESPSPEPEGRDVGIGFNLCGVNRFGHLGGIDYLGDGTNGQAWIGVATKEDGTCPSDYRPGAYVVAADADGDGSAEAFTQLPWDCNVGCVPYDATDLDADGTEELIVASSFSIMDYFVLRYLDPPDEPSPVIVPVLVAQPGHEPAGLRSGEPLRIDAGGDAGYGSQIECEGYPEAPVIVWSWSFLAVESEDPREVHVTRIQLQDDGAAHVVGTNDYTVPFDQPSGVGRSEAPACGVDWHPNA